MRRDALTAAAIVSQEDPAVVDRASPLTKAYSILPLRAASDRMQSAVESDSENAAATHLGESCALPFPGAWVILCEAAVAPSFTANPHQALRE
jgi:hypothetical protein